MWDLAGPRGAVVVGADSSWESQNAVVVATREAARRGSRLVLLAIAERPLHWPGSLGWISWGETEAERQAQAAADLLTARVLATDPTVAVQSVVVRDFDDPVVTLVSRDAELLVLGRRGDGGRATFSLGSTSAELARRFACPVLVVHDRRPPDESHGVDPGSAVIAGIDNAVGTREVLSAAVNEASIRCVPLVIVHAMIGVNVGRGDLAERWRTSRAAIRAVNPPPDLHHQLVITQDDPVRALLHRAGVGDVLVVGTRGQGRLAGLIGGSVSRQVLNLTECDVIVVQPPPIQAIELPMPKSSGVVVRA